MKAQIKEVEEEVGMAEQPQGQPQGQQEGQSEGQLDKKSQAYITGLSRMLHNSKTSKNILEMLKSGEPQDTISTTALTVNSQMEKRVTQAGKKPDLDVLLNAAVFLVGDLIEIGNAAGIFQIQDEQEIGQILQNTLQTYIEDGLKNGTVDPVELQHAVEPLMDEDHRAMGMEAANMSGIPQEANESTAMQSYGAEQKRAGALQGGGQR